jgi:hypothetical protein
MEIVFLEKNDEKLLQIEELIYAKRKMLLDKQQKIQLISKQNLFLDTVKSDYDMYCSYIIQQKREQMEALELLNKYIDDLTISGKLSQHNIEDAKFEQKKILNELNKIKKGLDRIIKNTNEIVVHVNEKNI